MKKEHIHNPDDFGTAAGKLRAIQGSLDGLLDGTEAFRLRSDLAAWIAAVTASLVITHQVIAAMLEEEM